MRKDHEIEEKNELISVKKAGQLYNVSHLSLWAAIRCGRLKKIVIDGRVFLNRGLIDQYLESKYDREYSLRDGKLLYNREAGRYSPKMCEELFNVPKNHLYHAIYSGKLKATKSGHSYVIDHKDIVAYVGNGVEIRKYAKTKNPLPERVIKSIEERKKKAKKCPN